jgi:4Fe-4S iron-sulfur cluster binding domain/DR2241 stabilising domain
MTAFKNPALEHFLSQLGDGLVLAQVLVRAVAGGRWELRHEADAAVNSAALKDCAVSDLRALAQSTAAGAFRPLKAAPNLRQGWRAEATTAEELESALHQLYPGALADWHAVATGRAQPTHYREYTNRQTGMYRITAMLDEAQAAEVISVCCAKPFCLKRRLWTSEALAPDPAEHKSIIPCLEPCAVWLEFARKAMRISQEPAVPVSMSASELETLQAALESAVASGAPGEASQREADFAEALNPRRTALLLRKLAPAQAQAKAAASEKK